MDRPPLRANTGSVSRSQEAYVHLADTLSNPSFLYTSTQPANPFGPAVHIYQMHLCGAKAMLQNRSLQAEVRKSPSGESQAS